MLMIQRDINIVFDVRLKSFEYIMRNRTGSGYINGCYVSGPEITKNCGDLVKVVHYRTFDTTMGWNPRFRIIPYPVICDHNGNTSLLNQEWSIPVSCVELDSMPPLFKALYLTEDDINE